MELNQYIKELEYLVNIDSGADSLEGLAEMADFLPKERSQGGRSVSRGTVTTAPELQT